MNVLVRTHTLSASIQSSLRFHKFASIWIIDYVIYLRFSYFFIFSSFPLVSLSLLLFFSVLYFPTLFSSISFFLSLL
jgi:hypothetical protein